MRELVGRFVDAWNRADVDAIVALLREDASFSMPPLETWFRGRADIAAFIAAARIFRAPWRFEATTASGQPALIGHRREELGVLMVLTLEGEAIADVTAFLGTGVLARFRPGEKRALDAVHRIPRASMSSRPMDSGRLISFMPVLSKSMRQM